MSGRVHWLGLTGFALGVTSVLLGAAGVGAVLCLWYPSLLTTPALRDVYDIRLIRWIIKTGSSPASFAGSRASSSSGARRWASPGPGWRPWPR